MSRRVAVLTAGASVMVLVGLLFGIRVDYSVLSPGPTCNTVGDGNTVCASTSPMGIRSPLIAVPAAYDHPSSSHLSLLTVSEQDNRPSAGSAIFDWLRSGYAVVPREVLHPPGKSTQQVQQQDVADMVMAQDAAVVAAELPLGLALPQVVKVTPGSPAAAALRPGDLVLSADGTAVHSVHALIDAVAGTDTSTVYELRVRRAGKELTARLHKALIGGRAVLGVALRDAAGVPVTITLDPHRIGGPSAGLMFALGVYDRLTPGDLAGTTVVAGTGTIGADGMPGDVGAIGGIQQKLSAAKDDVHATVFLAPRANCADTRGAVPAGLRVVPVDTFGQALSALAAVRAGRAASLPRC